MHRIRGGGDRTAAVKKGPWTPEEDEVLRRHVREHGAGEWSSIRSRGLLPRTGKSCRLRWVNKLRPNLKTGIKFSEEEERAVLDLQAQFGNRWARIATYLPGRTDNDVKNFWSTRQKRLARILSAPLALSSRRRSSRKGALRGGGGGGDASSSSSVPASTHLPLLMPPAPEAADDTLLPSPPPEDKEAVHGWGRSSLRQFAGAGSPFAGLLGPGSTPPYPTGFAATDHAGGAGCSSTYSAAADHHSDHHLSFLYADAGCSSSYGAAADHHRHHHSDHHLSFLYAGDPTPMFDASTPAFDAAASAGDGGAGAFLLEPKLEEAPPQQPPAEFSGPAVPAFDEGDDGDVYGDVGPAVHAVQFDDLPPEILGFFDDPPPPPSPPPSSTQP